MNSNPNPSELPFTAEEQVVLKLIYGLKIVQKFRRYRIYHFANH